MSGRTVENRWRSGAIHFSKYNNVPILPVFISSKTTFTYNFFQIFFLDLTCKTLILGKHLKKMYIGLTVGSAIYDINGIISPEILRDMVYELGDKSYILRKYSILDTLSHL